MKNLNEPHKNVPSAKPRDAEVIPLESRRSVAESRDQLIVERQIEDLRQQWNTNQARFVDDPRKAVEEASVLVTQAIRQIEEYLRDRQWQVEKEWYKEKDVSTEDLRKTLQRYRTLFDRLLSL